MKKLILGVFFLIIALVLVISPTFADNFPTSIDQCKKDLWKDYKVFKNQGDCVSYVSTKGKNLPAGAPVLVDTITVDPTSYVPTNSHITLNNGSDYLFQVSGSYTNRDGSEGVDAEYVSEDNWLTKTDGLSGWPLNDYWNELDLMVNNNFVDWLELNPSVQNVYNYHYVGTGNPVSFMVFDGSPDIKVINEAWYSDNLGGVLTVNIYKN